MDILPAVVPAVQLLPVDQLKPNPWNRTVFDPDAMKDLVASVKAVGIREDLHVRPLPDGIYQIVSGHRRWLAAKEAGLKEVPCKVQPATDEQVAEDNLTINLQREDIPPLELARMVNTYIDQFKKTPQEAAEKFGKSRPWVVELTGFLGLPDGIKESVKALTLGWDQLRALKAASPEIQAQVAQDLKDGKLKPQDVAKRCKQLQPAKAGAHAPSHPRPPADTAISDPLAKLWAQAKYTLNGNVGAFWEASFGPQKIPVPAAKGMTLNGWTIKVSPTNQEAAVKDFARWLYQVSLLVAKEAGIDPTKSSMDEVIEQKVQMDAMMQDLAAKYPPPAAPAESGGADTDRQQRLEALKTKYGRIL